MSASRQHVLAGLLTDLATDRGFRLHICTRVVSEVCILRTFVPCQTGNQSLEHKQD